MPFDKETISDTGFGIEAISSTGMAIEAISTTIGLKQEEVVSKYLWNYYGVPETEIWSQDTRSWIELGAGLTSEVKPSSAFIKEAVT
tara:strand:- start:360 stop:620 length:261 start_codon:yes stop_codon:yes gene_type:complete